MSEQQGNYNIEQIRKENAVLRKYAAFQKAFEDKIGVQKIYIDIAGDIESAFILDEIIFFTLPQPDKPKSALRIWKDGVLWMAVSRSEWWERKRLTARQADRAIEKLLEKNLIFKTLHRFKGQATTHLRLNVPEFFKLYSEALEKANPPENENDTIIKDIGDLYAMMGEPEQVLPNGDTPPEVLPDGHEVLPDGDTASPNGESNNIPHASSTHPKRGDLIDGFLDLSQSPGIKKAVRIDNILSYLGGKLHINTETKRWKDFAKFADERHQLHKEDLATFVSWLTRQKNFDIQFWPPSKMQEMWPQAFVSVTPLLPTVDQMDDWRKGINL